jgi:hypothetical protein
MGDQKMMTKASFFRYVAIAGVCSVVFVWGCPQQGQPEIPIAPEALKVGAVQLALKPAVGQQTTYRITEKKRKNIKWEGPVPDKALFEESSNEEKVEMVVTQRIQNVDPNGKTTAQVTFDTLKYNAVVKNLATVDFDSSRQADANNVLNRLIGKSYTIEFGPDNSVIATPDLNELRQMFSGHTANYRAVNNLLLDDSVIECHSTLLLPAADAEGLRPGNTWSKVKTYSFGLMGIRSYEKIYKLREIQDVEGHQVAVIDMTAIPSAEVESKFRDKQAGANFPKMFDTNEIYVGSGEVDVTAGRINKYSENLVASWIAALPPNPGEQADANEPVVLKMTAARDYKLEMIE